MAAGCVWASYSTAFNLAAFLVAFTSLIKSCGLGSQAVDLAAVPCALYTTISFWALLTGFLGGPEGVWPHVTRNVSLPLIQGQAQLPLLAWNLAQNAEAVHLMSFAVSKRHDSCPCWSLLGFLAFCEPDLYMLSLTWCLQLQTNIAMYAE